MPNKLFLMPIPESIGLVLSDFAQRSSLSARVLPTFCRIPPAAGVIAEDPQRVPAGGVPPIRRLAAELGAVRTHGAAFGPAGGASANQQEGGGFHPRPPCAGRVAMRSNAYDVTMYCA